jgi:uncharacterized membrane protein
MIALADFSGHELGNALLRWIHILAGILWIGHLYFFNFVQGQFEATLDAETKKKVIPQLRPRALFWFRWGAAYTWITGVLLALMLYWIGPNFTTDGTRPAAGQWLSALALILIGFVIYDVLAKSLAKQPMASLWIWYAIVTAYSWGLSNCPFYATSDRASLIHAGAMLGTAMAANVWMRIWPLQRRIITAIKNGQAPDPADPALAGLRSKHNTFMSVPLLLLMLSVHGNAGAGVSFGEPWMWVAGTCALGFFATQWLYKTAGKVPGF